MLNAIFFKPVGAAIAKRRAYHRRRVAANIEQFEADLKALRAQADERAFGCPPRRRRGDRASSCRKRKPKRRMQYRRSCGASGDARRGRTCDGRARTGGSPAERAADRRIARRNAARRARSAPGWLPDGTACRPFTISSRSGARSSAASRSSSSPSVLFRKYVLPAVRSAQIARNAELVERRSPARDAQDRSQQSPERTRGVRPRRSSHQGARRELMPIASASDCWSKPSADGERAVSNARGELERARLAARDRSCAPSSSRSALKLARANADSRIDATVNARLVGRDRADHARRRPESTA